MKSEFDLNVGMLIQHSHEAARGGTWASQSGAARRDQGRGAAGRGGAEGRRTALLDDEAAHGRALVDERSAAREGELGGGEGQVLVLDLGLREVVLPIRQDLLQVVDERWARLCTPGAGQLLRCGGKPPPPCRAVVRGGCVPR